MADLLKVKESNFETVYPILSGLYSGKDSRDKWKRLFYRYWRSDEDYVGYMLVDEGKIVGFIGLLFSRRFIRGSEHKFCNVTSWIVDDGYRVEGIRLLIPVIKLTDYIVTNFTPSQRVCEILKGFGFKEAADTLKLIPFYLSASAIFSSKRCCVYSNGDVVTHLDGMNKSIYEDHAIFPSEHIYISSKLGDCYLVMTRAVKKRLPFLFVNYVSNKDVFAKVINDVIFQICIKMQVVGLISEEHSSARHSINGAIYIKRPSPSMFKSDHINREDIDSLYSENFVLNIDC
jgi:hypothetical protein